MTIDIPQIKMLVKMRFVMTMYFEFEMKPTNA